MLVFLLGLAAVFVLFIKDVKVLLNSEPHSDHAGGLAVLQQASGAELWASEASTDAEAEFRSGRAH